MSQYQISIEGLGPHHASAEGPADQYDAEKLAAQLVSDLVAKGHTVQSASFVYGSRDDLLVAIAAPLAAPTEAAPAAAPVVAAAPVEAAPAVEGGIASDASAGQAAAPVETAAPADKAAEVGFAPAAPAAPAVEESDETKPAV